MKYEPKYNRKLVGDFYDFIIEDGKYIFKRKEGLI